jgi:mannose-6-phosphate isomerase-like protein (cupin superfamily)
VSDPTTTSTPRPRPVAPGQGVMTADVGPGFPRMEVKLAAADGLGFSVIEQHIPPRFTPPPVQHRQTREAAAVYVLEGELQYQFDDGEVIAGAGTLVPLPRMVWWRWANNSDRPCRVLAIFAPAGFERYFLELTAAIASAGGPQAAADTFARLRAQYGDEERSPDACAEH